MENIKSNEEKETLEDIVSDASFMDLEMSYLQDTIEKKFEDYEDYSQITESSITGIWFQLLQKDDGTIFYRFEIGNELKMPDTHLQFANLSAGKLNGEYSAKDLVKYFVPFGAYINLEDIEQCESHHYVFDLKDIKDNTCPHNDKIQKLYDLGMKLLTPYAESISPQKSKES